MTRAGEDEPTTITAYPDGPLILRGPAVLVDEDGVEVERRRGTVALCRCGMSRIAPLCDGTHKAAQHAAARKAEQRAAARGSRTEGNAVSTRAFDRAAGGQGRSSAKPNP